MPQKKDILRTKRELSDIKNVKAVKEIIKEDLENKVEEIVQETEQKKEERKKG